MPSYCLVGYWIARDMCGNIISSNHLNLRSMYVAGSSKGLFIVLEIAIAVVQTLEGLFLDLASGNGSSMNLRCQPRHCDAPPTPSCAASCQRDCVRTYENFKLCAWRHHSHRGCALGKRLAPASICLRAGLRLPVPKTEEDTPCEHAGATCTSDLQSL